MSSFFCEKCNKAIIDTPNGYISECKHYPLSKKQKKISNTFNETLNLFVKVKL